MGFFSKGLKNEFETAVVNEPSVFEPLKFYCICCYLHVVSAYAFHIIKMLCFFCLFFFQISFDPGVYIVGITVSEPYVNELQYELKFSFDRCPDAPNYPWHSYRTLDGHIKV